MAIVPRLLLVALLVGCSAADEPATTDPRPRVVTVSAEPAPPTSRRVLFGVLAATRDATLSARVPGAVTARLVEPGAAVAEGAPLLAFDAREARANLASAEAALEDAEAALEDAEAEVKRAETLGDAAASADLERARIAFRRARAAAARARAARDLAAIQVGYHTIRAPFPGSVASLDPEVGELVPAGSPVARVVDVSSFEVVVGLVASEVALLADPRTRFTVRAEGVEIPAVVTNIPAAADPATLDWKVELAVPAHEGLWPGLPVEVEAALANPPATARIDRRGVRDGLALLVVDGQVQHRPVEVLGEQSDALLVRGVQVGEPVIVRGADGLSEGQAVVVLGEGG